MNLSWVRMLAALTEASTAAMEPSGTFALDWARSGAAAVARRDRRAAVVMRWIFGFGIHPL